MLRSREKPLKLSCTNLRWFCFEHARLRHLPESSKIPRQLEEPNTEALILEQRAALLTAVCNGVEQFPAAANELGNHEEAGPIDARLAVDEALAASSISRRLMCVCERTLCSVIPVSVCCVSCVRVKTHSKSHASRANAFAPLAAPCCARRAMAHLYSDLAAKSLYTDRKFMGGQKQWQRQLEESTTLYVGNLSFYTTEEQLYAMFGRVGEVKRIIMGLDRNTKTPCGFCFVEYHRRADTEDAVRYISGCKLDDRILRVDYDGGFVEGRQYGRGRSGGQVRDEYRTDYDAGRGGWGKAIENDEGGGNLAAPRRMSMPPAMGSGSAEPTAAGETAAADRGRTEEEPSAKRSRQEEANPRFRADKGDDDDDDD